MKPSHISDFLLCAMLGLPLSGMAVECGESLFTETTAASVAPAKERFDALLASFKPDANVDTILEVAIDGKTVADVERIVSDGQANYFTPDQNFQNSPDGFSQGYRSADGEWKKTIKVTTHNPKGQAIVPYLQIFYEDKFGGVIRLKPHGNSDAPAALTHLKQPHGTEYFKLDPNGDLSYENEAFKVYALKPYPKAPNQVSLPKGVAFGTPAAEDYLKSCWTFKTHVPLAE
jgi:hypothetical protein